MADENKQNESGKKQPALNKYFKSAIKLDASDLHMKPGQPVKVRISGTLKALKGEFLTPERMHEMALEIMKEDQREQFKEMGQFDFAYEYDKENRFRVNVFKQRGNTTLVARRVNASIPPFESLHLPDVIQDIANSHEGLVLVVGATGSGKSTTIASMIDHITKSRACHIVSIEDPIEYLFQDHKASVSQREVGIDVSNYDEALRALMRQDPDVVMIGEMRDAETVTAAMRAAETGHLVFGTMHSANASQSVQRLLDLFPQEERGLVRQTLSLCVKAIISQALMPSLKPEISRVPAIEVLIANSTVKKLIREERENDLPNVIKNSQNEGMQDFTTHLTELIKNGMVDPKEAFRVAPNVEELKMSMKGIRTSSSGLL